MMSKKAGSLSLAEGSSWKNWLITDSELCGHNLFVRTFSLNRWFLFCFCLDSRCLLFPLVESSFTRNSFPAVSSSPAIADLCSLAWELMDFMCSDTFLPICLTSINPVHWCNYTSGLIDSDVCICVLFVWKRMLRPITLRLAWENWSHHLMVKATGTKS